MSIEVGDDGPVSVVHGSMMVSRVQNSEDVAITAYAEAVRQVLQEFSVNQFTQQVEPLLRVTRETAQSLYDELFMMGFRFSEAESRRNAYVRLVTEPVAAESPPSSTKIRGVNPACDSQWFVESSDEHA
jgi:hypothetical protein